MESLVLSNGSVGAGLGKGWELLGVQAPGSWSQRAAWQETAAPLECSDNL